MQERLSLGLGSMGNPEELVKDPYKNGIGSQHLNEVDINPSVSPVNVALASSPDRVTLSETSGPPSPREGLIPNFGVIDREARIYRSSFPHVCNLNQLKSLELRTVITLVPTAFEPDVEEWLASSSIQHFRINIPAHKSSKDYIPIEAITQVMNLMIDETKRPLLIHCNKGKHRTGCMTACYRKLCGADGVGAITEYHYYAGTKARAYDIAFISGIQPKKVSQAVYDLRDSVEPICYRHLHHISDGVSSSSIAENGEVDENAERISYSLDERECADVLLQRFGAGRSLISPEPPLSPPFSIPINLELNANELADALSRIDDRQERAALTPPQTPWEDFQAKYSRSMGKDT